jgi:argonaute-like protein implicated in RNA metabolism and viral defense
MQSKSIYILGCKVYYYVSSLNFFCSSYIVLKLGFHQCIKQCLQKYGGKIYQKHVLHDLTNMTYKHPYDAQSKVPAMFLCA